MLEFKRLLSNSKCFFLLITLHIHYIIIHFYSIIIWHQLQLALNQILRDPSRVGDDPPIPVTHDDVLADALLMQDGIRDWHVLREHKTCVTDSGIGPCVLATLVNVTSRVKATQQTIVFVCREEISETLTFLNVYSNRNLLYTHSTTSIWKNFLEIMFWFLRLVTSKLCIFVSFY